MFRIKICGVTRAADARIVALAGADAIGLNFYPGSTRFLRLEKAEQIIAATPKHVAKVGVFVNAPPNQIVQVADRLGLDWIQLHGDESPDCLAELGGRPVVRAFRFRDGAHAEIGDYLQACGRAGRMPDAALVDACVAGEFGGTGVAVDWSAASKVGGVLNGLPWVLAGGLTPFNVAQAIAATKPAAVDVASGVESKAGLKDAMLVRAFVTAAARAFAETGNRE